MKLVYIINSLGAGGAERHLLNLVRNMVVRNYEVWVVVLKHKIQGGANSLEHEFVEAGAEIIYLRSYSMSDAGRWYSLVKQVKKLQPDIIHSHLPRSDLAASIAKRALPEIFWISTIHDTYSKDKYSGHWVFPFVKRSWQRADYFIAVSRHVKEWGELVIGLPQHKIRVIYHGVPLYEIPDFIHEKKSSDSFQIGCLARFEKRKGMETLVRAMVEVKKKFPDSELLLAGSDPTGYSQDLKYLAKSLKVENNVKVLGFCSNPLEFLHDLDVFAFASTSEGFGIVLIEAMSMKRPIVASNIYPINYIVQDRVSGLLVESCNHHAFAKALIGLLDDPVKRLEMGDAGYERCINEFSLEQSLNKIHDLYFELISNFSSVDKYNEN